MHRPFEHWKSKKQLNAKDHCHAWIRSLVSEGFIPEICILEECSSIDELNKSEEFWISYFKMIGADLTNLRPGGNNSKPTIETRRKMSQSAKGNPGLTGKNHSQETKDKIANKLRGKFVSEETREKMRLAKLGNHNRIGTKHSVEAIEKIRQKQKQRWKKKDIK